MTLCKCGCGQSTSIAKYTDRRFGWIRGKPKTFINGHWRRGKRAGDAANIAARSRPLQNGCIEWAGAKDKDGYALFTPYGQPTKRLARYLYTLQYGPLEPTQFVCHTCDNPSCINVVHLFVGSTQTNMDDMKQKQRQSQGEKHAKTKLTARQVRKIRASPLPHAVLAAQYGTCYSTIGNIKHRRTWKRLP